MPRTPTKAVIAAEERGLLERQRVFRFAADRVTAALAQCGDVEAIALIGSVGRPLRREVPRFAPYKQLRLPIAHECKDVDLAAWVSRVDGLDERQLSHQGEAAFRCVRGLPPGCCGLRMGRQIYRKAYRSVQELRSAKRAA